MQGQSRNSKRNACVPRTQRHCPPSGMPETRVHTKRPGVRNCRKICPWYRFISVTAALQVRFRAELMSVFG